VRAQREVIVAARDVDLLVADVLDHVDLRIALNEIREYLPHGEQ
jgi:hypothetical protein